MSKDYFTVVIYRDGFAIKAGKNLRLNNDGYITIYADQQDALDDAKKLNIARLKSKWDGKVIINK